MKCSEFRAKARHRIIIQAQTLTSDDFGGSETAWLDQTTVWAVLKPVSGRDVYMQEQFQSRVSHKIVIRYQDALKNTQDTAGNRISYDGRYFVIKHIRNLDRDMKNEGKDFQELFAEEGAPENES